MRIAVVALVAVSVLGASCGKKAPAAPVKLEGWQQKEGWKSACYFPKDYGEGDRISQNAVREAMFSQWRGERDDGVSFSDSVLERVETALLGKPDAVKGVALQNLDFCGKYMAGQADISAWQGWVAGLANSLTEGDCKWPPLRYQQHDYLEIDRGWQFEGRVCKGDKIRIEVSALDYYRLSDSGEWINADGIAGQQAIGEKYPCTIEGCNVGTVVYRFTGEDGSITIAPVGTGIEWEAPQHGILHLAVNDDGTYFDNVWRKKGSLVDHAAIAYVGLD